MDCNVCAFAFDLRCHTRCVAEIRCLSLCVYCYTETITMCSDNEEQGDYLSGKPGNVREFDSCQGNVKHFTKSQGNVRKNLVRENLRKTVYYKLHISVHTGI